MKNLSGGKLGSLLVKKSDDDFDIGWNTELIVQLGDALAKYEYLLEIIADDKQALVREIKKLTAEFNNADAQIIEELLVMASENEALARKITKLRAELGDNFAGITQTLTTQVTELGALAQLVTELEVSFNSQIATVTEYAEVTAGQVTGLTTVVDGLEGDVSTIAGEVNTLEIQVSDVRARWGVEVDAGGRVAGIQLNSSNTGSSNFIVLADNFKVYRSGYTSDPIFATGTVNGVATVGIKGNLVVDGSIITKGIANSAVTQSYFTFQGTHDVTLNFSVTGASSEAYDVYILGNWVQSYTANTYMYLNGTQIRFEFPSGGTLGTMMFKSTLAPGSHSVRLVSLDTRNSNGTGIYVLVTKR